MARMSNDFGFRMVLGPSASGPIHSYCRISEARNLKNWHRNEGVDKGEWKAVDCQVGDPGAGHASNR